MARLPTKEELGKPVDLASRGGIASIGVPNASGIGVGSAIANLGQNLASAAASIHQANAEDDNIDVTRADAQAKINRLKFSSDLVDNDPDYATWGPRFEEADKKNVDEAAALIRNSKLREKFKVQASVDTASANNRIISLARERDKDTKKAGLVASLDSSRERYLDPSLSDEERLRVRDDMNAYIDLNVKSGLISAEQAITLKDKLVKSAPLDLAKILFETNPKALYAETQGTGPYKRWLRSRESGGNSAVINDLGYAGLYQYGAPRVTDLGVYTPGDGEKVKGKWSGKKWTGTFNIPGFPSVKTVQDFLANPAAQEAVNELDIRKMDEEIATNGLDKYEGATVGGVKITREGLYAMLHLGGVGSTSRALASNGSNNPADANGTTVLDYAAAAGGKSFFNEIDPVDRAEIKAKAERTVKLNDIQLGISNGTLSRAQVEAVMSEFDYNDQLKIERAWTAREKQNEAVRFTQMVADPNWIPNPADPEHKKALDAAWLGDGEMGHQRLIARDTDYFNENVVPLVATKRVIPPRLRGTLEAMTSSTDPQTMVYALDRMSDLERAAPTAWARDMSADMQQLLVRYRESLSVYTPEEIAAKLSSEAGNAAQKKTNEALIGEAKTEAGKLAPYVAGIILTGQAPGTALGRGTIGVINYALGAPMPAGPEREAMEQDFIEVFSRAMEKTGDKGLALKMTIPVMRQRWWVSGATGEKRWMRWAPEMFNPDGVDPVWIQHQSRARLFPLIGDGPFILQADDRTELEIQQGNTATYQVMVPKTLEQLANDSAKPSLEGYEIVGMRGSPE